MGLPIVGRLSLAGYAASVYDPDRSKGPEVADRGGRFVETPWEAIEDARVALVCVGFEEQVEELLLGPGRLLERSMPGTVFAIVSTVRSAYVQRLATEAERQGKWVIDAPVSGGSPAAAAGELLSLVGGPDQAVERLLPVLRAYSSEAVHLGSVGAGEVSKAVTNQIMWGCQVASHEGLALAQRFGLDVDRLRQALLLSSAANSTLVQWGTQGSVWVEHDMNVVTDMAAEVGISLPQMGVNREICRSLKHRLYKLEEYGA